MIKANHSICYNIFVNTILCIYLTILIIVLITLYSRNMIILDKPTDFDGENIFLNFYHRTPVSLIKDTKIWLCFIPKSEDIPYPELIISPIDFSAWDDLWRIIITLEDKIGIVDEILQTIKDNGINILSMETNSINSQKLHQIELIVDARRYSNTPYDKLYNDRKENLKINELRDLKRQFISRVIDNLHFVGIKPRIKINRIYGLYDAHRTFTIYQKKYPTHKFLSPKWGTSFVMPHRNKELYPSKIILPQLIRETLLECLGTDKVTPKIQYLPISDTKDRFMRVYFFNDSDKIISFTLRHREIVGAVATITSCLSAADFNILTSHSRVDKFGEKAITDFVVEHPQKEKLSLDALKKKLEDVLCDKELVDVYQVEISYPTKYNSTPKWKKLKSSNTQRKLLEGKQTTESRLLLKYSEYDRKRKKLSDKEKMRFELMYKLIREENLKEPTSERHSVFISYPFGNDELFQTAQGIMSSYGFNPVSGIDLSQGKTVRSELNLLIDNCDFFLGIWTKEKGVKISDNKWFPSPWLFWEWGVAEGKNKITRLVVNKDIDTDSFFRVAPEQPYQLFNYDIEKELRRVAEYFKKQIDNGKAK